MPAPSASLVVYALQAKRIDNTSLRDEPFEFYLGANTVRGRHW